MDGEDTQYELTEPFEIDGAALDHDSKQQAFAMGVEWQMFRQRLAAQKPFTVMCLSNNASRLARMAERHGRFVEHHNTDTHGWAEVVVGRLIRETP